MKRTIMHRLAGVRIAVLLTLAGCTTAAQPLQNWSLADLPRADMREMERSPTLQIELMVALTEATRRCAGPDYPYLGRTQPGSFTLRGDPESLAFGSPALFTVTVENLQRGYRRVHGPAWQEVWQADLDKVRDKYADHPDPDGFCRVAEDMARVAFTMGGRDRFVRMERLYRELAPENASPATP
jgi:hypothetical protein